ncbi:MAG: ABC transporter permease [Clostridioides sp.]|jgi:putative ABC transport system permease protein|nr:ABC transporter permease [Clostridioides sp.]
MKFYVIWRSALKAIMDNKKRSFLTTFGIIIGIAAVIAIMALGRGFEKDTIKSLTNSDTDDINVELQLVPNDESLYQTSIDMFKDSDLVLLRSVEGVEKAERTKNDSGYVFKDIEVRDKKENKQINLVEKTDKEILEGRNLTNADNDMHSKIATIDSELAEDIFGSAKNAIGAGIDLGGQLFTIVGVYPGSATESMFSMPDSNVMVPENSYNDYFGENQSNTTVTITIAKGATPNKVTEAAINKLNEYGAMRDLGKYEAFDMAFLTDSIGKMLSTITYFITSVAGISLFIAGVGVMNMMYISVAERTKEIGIRRAMGATEKAIRWQFLLEGITLTLIGGIIGYLLGISLAYIIGKVANISVSVDAFTISLAIGVSAFVGLAFSVVPASSAAKKDLIDILR